MVLRSLPPASGAESWNALQGQKFDCVVLDLRLPDMSGFELLERIRQEPELRDLPIVVFTGQELSEADELKLIRMAESVVLKGVESPERLLDETTLFLHTIAAELPPAKQQMLERLHRSDDALNGRKVLVVDDDVRNIFALTSLLEQHGLRVVNSETGGEAISLLDQDEEIDAVLIGHHDAGNGRLRNHAPHPPKPQAQASADSCSYRQSDERRPGEMFGSGGV